MNKMRTIACGEGITYYEFLYNQLLEKYWLYKNTAKDTKIY